MENPHTLLPFGPKTKGGHEIQWLTRAREWFDNYCELRPIINDVFYYPYTEKGEYYHEDSDGDGDKFMDEETTKPYDLIYTDSPPYAPQPYTLWEKEQENAKLKARIDGYEFALKAIHIYTTGDSNHPLGRIAREALKGGGDE
jgi:hypothetical protein